MKGRILVLEGTDSSGKSTQFTALCEQLTQRGVEFRRLVFPRYQEESSALIRMYLAGDFGSRPGDVSPYAASTFFAVDRYASYKMDWKDYYENGGLILADRYTTSNAVHQATKLEGEARAEFLDWLFDFEYHIMGIPQPDAVFFLDMPPEAAQQLLAHRTGKEEDIHEQDRAYQAACYHTADELARRFAWKRIPCVTSGSIRSIADINAELTAAVLRTLGVPEQ